MFLRNVRTNDYFYCIEELRVVGMTVEDVFFIIRTVTMLDGGALGFFFQVCVNWLVQNEILRHIHTHARTLRFHITQLYILDLDICKCTGLHGTGVIMTRFKDFQAGFVFILFY